jgi:hypothetical protein
VIGSGLELSKKIIQANLPLALTATQAFTLSTKTSRKVKNHDDTFPDSHKLCP